MSEYFEKAPLVYVVGSIKTTELAPLLSEQIVNLQQLMSECDFIYASEEPVTKVEFKISADDAGATKRTPHMRRCYHTSNKRNSLVIDPGSIEFRSTEYAGFDQFMEKFKDIFSKLNKTFYFWHNTLVQEVTYSYVNVIASFDEAHKLSDFFNDSIVLPLKSQNKFLQKDIIQIGKLGFSRIIEPNLRVNMSLEQLPIKAGKFVPDELVELNKDFGMPIVLDNQLADSKDNHYALLMSQASTIPSENTKLIDFDFSLFDKVHIQGKIAFLSMLNRDVTDNIWGYREGN